MNLKTLASLIVCIVMLCGCAMPKRPELSREQWLQLTTRTYPGATPEQVLAAAEKLFRLADGDDFTFSHSAEALQAKRQWSAYLVITAVFGSDHWRVTVRPDGGGTFVQVEASTQNQALMPTPTTRGGASIAPGALMGSMIDGDALYTLFWRRMDYLLGRRADWTTCRQFYDLEVSMKLWGNSEPLCNRFNITDTSPVPG